MSSPTYLSSTQPGPTTPPPITQPVLPLIGYAIDRQHYPPGVARRNYLQRLAGYLHPN